MSIFKNGYDKVFHFHCMKTGGTSINAAFVEFCKSKGEKYVEYVSAGMQNAVYGYAHERVKDVKLPNNTFTITCVRDPYTRLISRYKQLYYLAKENKLGPPHRTDGLDKLYDGILKFGFKRFIERCPKHEIQHQLFMFNGDIEFIKNNIHFVMRQERLDEDIKKLSNILGIDINLGNHKRYNVDVPLTKDDKKLAKKLVEEETEFINKLKKSYKNK